MLKQEYLNLTVAERILLVEEIWDSIANDAPVVLNTQQKKLLDRREADALAGKVSGKSWSAIKREVTKRKK